MTSPLIRIKLQDVPDAAACVRSTRHQVLSLANGYSALTAVFVWVACDSGQYQAHVDLHLPQHQILVSAAAPTTERAVLEAMTKAADELTRLAARDPSVATARQAKAA